MTSEGGVQYVQIASGTSANTNVKTAAGVLVKVIVTTNNTNGLSFFDSVGISGNAVFKVAAAAAIGTIYTPQIPCATGISVQGDSAAPGVTVVIA